MHSNPSPTSAEQARRPTRLRTIPNHPEKHSNDGFRHLNVLDKTRTALRPHCKVQNPAINFLRVFKSELNLEFEFQSNQFRCVECSPSGNLRTSKFFEGEILRSAMLFYWKVETSNGPDCLLNGTHLYPTNWICSFRSITFVLIYRWASEEHREGIWKSIRGASNEHRRSIGRALGKHQRGHRKRASKDAKTNLPLLNALMLSECFVEHLPLNACPTCWPHSGKSHAKLGIH